MSDSPESKQAQRMKRRIKDSFQKLLAEKPLTKISAVDLIEEADIGRSTFYRYYSDVYDLFSDCCMESGGKERNEPSRREDDYFNALYENILRGFVEAEEHELVRKQLSHTTNAVMDTYLDSNREQTRIHIKAVVDQMGLSKNALLFDYDYVIELLLFHFTEAVNYWLAAGKPLPAPEAASQSMLLFFRLVEGLKQGCPVAEMAQ